MESLDYSSFSFLPTLITSLVTGAITWLGTFIFYKQKRDGMDISNEAQRSAEWKKLYDESKRDSDEKDKKIDELRRQINELNRRMNEMDRVIQVNSIYRCESLSCKNRRPPLNDKPRNAKGQFIKQQQEQPVDPELNEMPEPAEDLYHSEQPEPPME